MLICCPCRDRVPAGTQRRRRSTIPPPEIRSCSPLSYPGSKSRILGTLLKHIPPDTRELVSPFVGGGALELALAHQGVRVIAYDVWDHLVNFWQQCLRSPAEVARRVRQHGPPVERAMHMRFREELKRPVSRRVSAVERAARFYIVNRGAFGGLMVRGTFGGKSGKQLTQASIERLAAMRPPPEMTVRQSSFEESIPKHPDAFLFCDPPYVGHEDVYGDPDAVFDHEHLAELLLERRGPWLLTCGEHDLIRELYSTPGVTIVPIVYAGKVRACKRDRRRDLIISRGPS